MLSPKTLTLLAESAELRQRAERSCSNSRLLRQETRDLIEQVARSKPVGQIRSAADHRCMDPHSDKGRRLLICQKSLLCDVRCAIPYQSTLLPQLPKCVSSYGTSIAATRSSQTPPNWQSLWGLDHRSGLEIAACPANAARDALTWW